MVKVRIRTLPDLWDQSAVFFANLECIFFGDPEKTREIVDNVTGFHGYGSRLIPILGLLFRGNENLLLLQELPEKATVEYFSQGLGLQIPDIHLVDIPYQCGPGRIRFNEEVKERITASKARFLDGYVTDPYLEEVAQELGKELINTYKACRDANDKVLLNSFLKNAGLPVFDGGETVIGKDYEARLQELKKMGYGRAAVRASLGASGFGMFIADLEELNPAKHPIHLFPEGKVLVQGWIEDGRLGASEIFSPSVQFFCGNNGEVVLFDVTDQLLSKSSIHEGNLSPPINIDPASQVYEEMLQQAGRVATWISSTGYKGTGSVDFLVFKKNGKPMVHVCEVNARVTGATYPSLVALRFNPAGAWLMRNMLFGPCMDGPGFMGYLNKKGILFFPGAKEGIVPLNIIEDKDGMVSKCQLLFLGESQQHCLKMIEEFPSLLPAECKYGYDRD